MTAGRHRQRLDWRVHVTIVAGVMAGVIMLLLDMRPRLVLVAFVVMAVAGATWLLLDLKKLSVPIMWQDYGTGEPHAARPDRRVRVLQSRLQRNARARRSETPGDTQPRDEIVDTLLDVIDDHLRAEHGIDRPHDPERAAAELGHELARFVDDPAARRSMAQRRSLSRTVSLIEAFVDTPSPTT